MGTVVVAGSSRGGKRKSAPAAITLSNEAQDEATMMQRLRQIIQGQYRQGLNALLFEPLIPTPTT